MNVSEFNKEPVWTPDEKNGKKMKAFIKIVENKYDLKFSDFWDFHRWTTEHISEFWEEIWNFFGIVYSKRYDQVIDLNIPMEESPKWFEGARLNYAENLLRFRDDRTALIVAGENREFERLSYKQLYEETRMYASALRKFGLQKGDTVACYMSNRKEALIAMLAVTSIGAIWTAILPTIGSRACVNRFKQVQPKILFTVDEFPLNTKTIPLLKNVKDVAEGLPTLEKVIIIASRTESNVKCTSDIRNSCFLDDFLKTAYNSDGTVSEIEFEQVSFSHPVFISYTSGTSGLPKTIVHGFGGLTIVNNLELHWDCDRDDTWLCFVPPGSVGWNSANIALFTGSTIVLFEGLPLFISPTYLWDLIDNLKITALFIAPYLLDEMEMRNCLPTEKHHLNSLKIILSAGNVVKPRHYKFVLKIKKGVQFVVAWGCTELLDVGIISDSMITLYEGEIPSPSLGISLECLDDEGNLVWGEMGELAISKPVPSLPIGIWEDSSGDFFRELYFSKFPGKFTIGDLIIINPITKGIIVCGRSDEDLKHGNYRFGCSEIYDIVKMFPEIRDSLCVGQNGKEGSQRVVLFLQMQKEHTFNEELVQMLRKRIAQELSMDYVPDIILEAPGIPYNAIGKKTEIIVKKIINKMQHNADSVVNSECLKFYYDVPELQGF